MLKLASLAKNRVKINDFTARDRGNLLDLFVNNERTLLKIYEILFPHRATPNQGAGVSSTMVEESGNGIYGQTAIRALTGHGSRGLAMSLKKNQLPINVDHITHMNQEILSQIQPNMFDYNSEMMNSGGFYP